MGCYLKIIEGEDRLPIRIGDYIILSNKGFLGVRYFKGVIINNFIYSYTDEDFLRKYQNLNQAMLSCKTDSFHEKLISIMTLNDVKIELCSII